MMSQTEQTSKISQLPADCQVVPEGQQQVRKPLTAQEIDAIVGPCRDKRLREETREFALERAKVKFGIKEE